MPPYLGMVEGAIKEAARGQGRARLLPADLLMDANSLLEMVARPIRVALMAAVQQSGPQVVVRTCRPWVHFAPHLRMSPNGKGFSVVPDRPVVIASLREEVAQRVVRNCHVLAQSRQPDGTQLIGAFERYSCLLGLICAPKHDSEVIEGRRDF